MLAWEWADVVKINLFFFSCVNILRGFLFHVVAKISEGESRALLEMCLFMES